MLYIYPILQSLFYTVTAKPVSHSKTCYLKQYIVKTNRLATQDCLSLDVIDRAGDELQYPPAIHDHEVSDTTLKDLKRERLTRTSGEVASISASTGRASRWTD